MTKPKRGRPATDRGAYHPLPVRQLGRVADDDWQQIKAAAKRQSKTFTQWAIEILLHAARRTK